MTIIDIFYEMETSKEIIEGKYYKRFCDGTPYEKMFREITKHEAVVRKLKGLATYKAYHINKEWKKAALIKIS